eukprot:TRINITY_DN7704_c0_g1_i1.p1 TRINITY_DN7704_c0_g1~~TRINITY_DN7704_c0_g1_i1.p1  ORF type:complete len:566 (-),score=154.98 TRINITY_DN7704_c0_g1_i1:218-1915(-)
MGGCLQKSKGIVEAEPFRFSAESLVEVLQEIHQGSPENAWFKRCDVHGSFDRIILAFPRYRRALATVQSVFSRVDVDGSGTIELDELNDALLSLNADVSDDVVREIFEASWFERCQIKDETESQRVNRFKTVTEQGLDFKSFLVSLALAYVFNILPDTPTKGLQGLGNPELVNTFNAMVECYLCFDRDASGTIEREEVYEMLRDRAVSKADKRGTVHRTPSMGKIGRESSQMVMNPLGQAERWKELDWDDSGAITFNEWVYTFSTWVGMDDHSMDQDEEVEFATLHNQVRRHPNTNSTGSPRSPTSVPKITSLMGSLDYSSSTRSVIKKTAEQHSTRNILQQQQGGSERPILKPSPLIPRSLTGGSSSLQGASTRSISAKFENVVDDQLLESGNPSLNPIDDTTSVSSTGSFLGNSSTVTASSAHTIAIIDNTNNNNNNNATTLTNAINIDDINDNNTTNNSSPASIMTPTSTTSTTTRVFQRPRPLNTLGSQGSIATSDGVGSGTANQGDEIYEPPTEMAVDEASLTPNEISPNGIPVPPLASEHVVSNANGEIQLEDFSGRDQ